MLHQSVLVMMLATLGAASIRTDDDPIQQLNNNAQPLTDKQYKYMMNPNNYVTNMLRNTYASKNMKLHMTLPYDQGNNEAFHFTDFDNASSGYTAKNVGGKNLWLATNSEWHVGNIMSRQHVVALRINSAGTALEAAFITKNVGVWKNETDQSSMTSEAATMLLVAFKKEDATVGLYDDPWVSMQEADQSGLLVSERCSFVSRDGHDLKDFKRLYPLIETGVYKIQLN